MQQQPQHQHQNSMREPSLKRSYPANTPRFYGQTPLKRQRFEGRSEKFEAFGKFLSTSLCDLPENKALELVQKFTNDLVKAFISPDEKVNDAHKKRIPMVTIQNANSENATVKTNGHQNGIEESSEDEEEEEDMDDDVQIL